MNPEAETELMHLCLRYKLLTGVIVGIADTVKCLTHPEILPLLKEYIQAIEKED